MGLETDPAAIPESEATVIEQNYIPNLAQQAASQDVPAAVLRVIMGADQGRVFALPLGQGIIGRGADCDVVLADIAVSRRHCAFHFDGQNVSLTDQGSGNGTKINGVKVRTQTLNHGDTIGLGKSELQFEFGGQPAVAAAPVIRPAAPVRPAPARPAPAPMPQAAVAAAPVPVAGGDAMAYGASPAAVAPQPAIPQSMLDANHTAQVAPLAPPNLEVSADLPSLDGGVDMPNVSVKVKVSGGGLKALYTRLTDTKQKKLIFFGVVGVFGFFLLVGIITSFMGPSKPKRRKAKTVSAEPKGPTPEQVFNRASAHIKAKQWTQALALLKQLQANDPSSKVYNDNAAYAENNLKANAVLDKARHAIQSGNLVRAELRINEDFLQDKRFLEKGTCKIALETCREARRLARRVRFMKAAPLVAEAREFAKSKKKKTRAQAMEKIQAALKIAPDAYPAQKIRHELGGAPPTAHPDPELDRIMADKNDPGAAVEPGGGVMVGGGGYGGLPKTAKTLYEAQDFAGAVRELTALATKRGGLAGKKLTKLATAISALKRAIQGGDAAISSDHASAIVQYTNALSYDAGLGGAHQALIKSKLFRVAKARASMLFSQGKYAASYAALRRAAQYGSEGLSRLQEQLSAKAQEIFNNGYIIRTSNPARARAYWRQVQNMVPASNTWHKKATFHIARHGGGGTVVAPMRARPTYVPRRRYTPPARRVVMRRRAAMRTGPRRRARRRYFVGGGDEDEDE